MNFTTYPDGEEVLQLAFVFRNADGTIVGRDSDGSDIFYDLFPPTGLFASIIEPAATNNFLETGDSLRLLIQLNMIADLVIRDNDVIIYQASSDQIDTVIVANEVGAHSLQFQASVSLDTIRLGVNYYVIESRATKDPPYQIANGSSLVKDSSVYFQLRAPNKTFAFLLCPGNGFLADSSFRMTQSLDGNTFWIEVDQSLFSDGKNAYQYLVDGEITIADPFSKVVLDPNNDSGISEEVLSELPDYPEDADGIVSVLEVGDRNFNWTDDSFSKPSKTNLVIYELMIRDFLADHSFTSLLDTLSYLKKLGVNAIELMPINEFEGNDSWGYNPSFHMAVDKYYGSRDQLRALINGAHELGIAVILDVVLIMLSVKVQWLNYIGMLVISDPVKTALG